MFSLKLSNVGQLVTFDSQKNNMVILENTEIAIDDNIIVYDYFFYCYIASLTQNNYKLDLI